MAAINLAVLGAGSVRCTAPLVSALATYYGERPLEIRLYDEDEERLDLFDRFARYCFRFTNAHHEVRLRPDPVEALEGAERVILQVGPNCARKRLKARGASFRGDNREAVEAALEDLVALIPEGALVVSLLPPDVRVPLEHFYRLGWPGELSLPERTALPHTILRVLNGEEYPVDWIRGEERSPLKAWLDDPETAEVVIVGDRR
jgi:hypothetical protein